MAIAISFAPGPATKKTGKKGKSAMRIRRRPDRRQGIGKNTQKFRKEKRESRRAMATIGSNSKRQRKGKKCFERGRHREAVSLVIGENGAIGRQGGTKRSSVISRDRKLEKGRGGTKTTYAVRVGDCN